MSLAAAFFSPDFDATTVHFALHAQGFPDAGRAEKLLRSLATTEAEQTALSAVFDVLVQGLSESADPSRALLNLSNLRDRMPDKVAVWERLEQNPRAVRRLTRLLSWSQALSDAVIRTPENIEIVFHGGTSLSRPELRKMARQCLDLDALRRFRKAHFLRIGLLDLDRDTWQDERDFHLVVRQISDLAHVVTQRALELVTQDETSGFCVLMMGKGGARELNYSSDIDLIFLAEDRPDARAVGEKLLRVLSESTASGFLWRADVRLRPDGGNGALVTPFGYALSYYESYAGAWEWQALIKARVVAGDARLGRRFRKFTRSITWAKRSDDTHLREVFEMKRRSEKTPDGLDERNVKSGPGGIRDAEWVVQQLQMMVGPSHPRARAADSLRALEQLDALGALSPDEVRSLREGYLWLRVAEHRLQLWNEQPVRQLPEKAEEKAALARRLGCPWRSQAATRWLDEEATRYRNQIRALCERLFWSFSSESGADWLEQVPENIQNDKQSVARLERLANGTKTRPLPAPLSRQIRAVMPGALRGIEYAANPERALVAFENLCEASGNRLSLLRALDGAPRLCNAIWTMLGGSQTLSDTLVRNPQLLDLAANRLLLERGKSWEEARAGCRDYALTFRDRKAAMRRWRERELLRIGLRDLVLEASPHQITTEIALLAQACLDLSVDEVRATLRPASNAVTFTVIGLGKFGGVEMHYASDCDVLFVYSTPQPSPAQSALAVRWAEELISFLGDRTEDGPGFALDTRLRPHGSSGALASSVEALRDYFENPTSGFAAWERQALTRARLSAGDVATGARAMALIQDAAHPAQWNPRWSDELRHIKSRVENERAARGAFNKSGKASTTFDIKLGPGGLSDIEWTAQWLALKHGAQFPPLQTASTRFQLQAAREAQLLSEAEGEVMEEAYTWLRRAELRLQIAREGAAKATKRDSPDFVLWARALFPGLEAGAASERFETQWKTHTERAREIFERVRDEL